MAADAAENNVLPRKARGPTVNITPPQYRHLIPGQGLIPGVWLSENNNDNNEHRYYRGHYPGAQPTEFCNKSWPQKRTKEEALKCVTEWLNKQHTNKIHEEMKMQPGSMLDACREVGAGAQREGGSAQKRRRIRIKSSPLKYEYDSKEDKPG